MHLTCIGCRRNFDNRRAYGGHRTRCPEYQALQQGTLSAPAVTTHLDITVAEFYDPTADIDYEPQTSSFLQDEASNSSPVRTDAPLTIKLPPVCNF